MGRGATIEVLFKSIFPHPPPRSSWLPHPTFGVVAFQLGDGALEVCDFCLLAIAQLLHR